MKVEEKKNLKIKEVKIRAYTLPVVNTNVFFCISF